MELRGRLDVHRRRVIGVNLPHILDGSIHHIGACGAVGGRELVEAAGNSSATLNRGGTLRNSLMR